MNPHEQGGTAQKIVWTGQKCNESQQLNNISMITPAW